MSLNYLWLFFCFYITFELLVTVSSFYILSINFFNCFFCLYILFELFVTVSSFYILSINFFNFFFCFIHYIWTISYCFFCLIYHLWAICYFFMLFKHWQELFLSFFCFKYCHYIIILLYCLLLLILLLIYCLSTKLFNVFCLVRCPRNTFVIISSVL